MNIILHIFICKKIIYHENMLVKSMCKIFENFYMHSITFFITCIVHFLE